MRSMRERVAGVADLVEAYVRSIDAEDAEDVATAAPKYLADLMCDLRHWAGREGVPFSAAWSLATTNFSAEVQGHDEDEPRDLSAAHPDLCELLLEGFDMDAADWDTIDAFLNRDVPPPPPPVIVPDLFDRAPPHGIIDNIHRAARVDGLVQTYAQRVGLDGDEPYTQLADFLCDLRHYAVAHRITIAPPQAPSYPGGGPWQEAVRMWVEETLGADTDPQEPLESRVPDLVARVSETLHLAPGSFSRHAEISAREWATLNRLAYWELNADAPQVSGPDPISLTDALFDDYDM